MRRLPALVGILGEARADEAIERGAGAAGWTAEIGGGSRDRIAEMSDAWLAPANAFFPVAIS